MESSVCLTCHNESTGIADRARHWNILINTYDFTVSGSVGHNHAPIVTKYMHTLLWSASVYFASGVKLCLPCVPVYLWILCSQVWCLYTTLPGDFLLFPIDRGTIHSYVCTYHCSFRSYCLYLVFAFFSVGFAITLHCNTIVCIKRPQWQQGLLHGMVSTSKQCVHCWKVSDAKIHSECITERFHVCCSASCQVMQTCGQGSHMCNVSLNYPTSVL